jgi:hypothetical protein
MCNLSDIVGLIVSMLSFALFTIIEVVSAALIETLTVPGTIIFSVMGNIIQGFTIVLEYMIGCAIELFVTSTLGCMRFIQEAFSAIVGLLGTVFSEFLVYLHTGLQAFADLVGEILWNTIELLVLSLLTIWNYFVDVVASLISNE